MLKGGVLFSVVTNMQQTPWVRKESLLTKAEGTAMMVGNAHNWNSSAGSRYTKKQRKGVTALSQLLSFPLLHLGPSKSRDNLCLFSSAMTSRHTQNYVS